MIKFYSYLPMFKYFSTREEYKIKIEESDVDWLQNLHGINGGNGYVLAVGNNKKECQKYIEEYFDEMNKNTFIFRLDK